MSIPEKPITRDDRYLHRLATGQGDIDPPVLRDERYLCAAIERLEGIDEDISELQTGKVDVNQGAENEGKALVIDENGVVVPGEVGGKGAVRYDVEQSLTDEQKAKARQNVGAQETIPEHTYDTYGAAETVQGNLDTHAEDGTIHVNSAEKEAWNGKYAKPTTGIPKTDLASGVQESLGRADTALQEHQSLSAYRTAEAQDTIDNGKQPVISDLDNIRSGASAGATALQSVPNTYRTAAAQDEIDAQKYSASNPPPYPVTSVNGQTGGVVLNYITYDEEEE